MMNILFEAIFVGLFLLPVYWVSEQLASGYGKWVVVFLSGALFHIVAEILGINKYYVQMKK
jgi:hypothetical protein